jgi:hypothetical protein
MCLTSITKIHEPPKEELLVGWKIMRPFEKGFASLFNFDSTPLTPRAEYLLGEWVIDEKFCHIEPADFLRQPVLRFYTNGFHIFQDEHEALDIAQYVAVDWFAPTILLKVEYDGVVAEGIESIPNSSKTERDCRVAVARKMKIVEPVALQSPNLAYT